MDNNLPVIIRRDHVVEIVLFQDLPHQTFHPVTIPRNHM